ncbi:membrane protein insertion efficiency factor YidD [Blattabacterium cuenoti]|uniref:membrane protein insertion efficiency factor YidD n=1 Tax=Blattabacterium cuenoti TaxID=1653831 RepID=UPI00163CAD28|nr:membrane protein insertion efficiency factor YidD [Blattabacterium cuenoti]
MYKKNNVFNIFLLKIVQFYQIGISPWIGKHCRYIPSCSDYMIQSLTTYSFYRAILIIFKRIIRCHPWGKSGYDPIK